MPTSQEQFLSEILSGEPIPVETLVYFRERLRTKLHQLVLREFLRQEREEGLRKADLACRLGRKREQITRWLGAPGNWTLDTVSDLLLSIGVEPIFRNAYLRDRLALNVTPAAPDASLVAALSGNQEGQREKSNLVSLSEFREQRSFSSVTMPRAVGQS